MSLKSKKAIISGSGLSYSRESLWATRLLVTYPGSLEEYRPLDYKPITFDSERTVHLILFGITDMAMEIARQAALICHFPNYTRDLSLKTKIIFVDADADILKDRFVSANKFLMDNSFYKTIDIISHNEGRVMENHYPQYHETRKDFVDIEWEFIKGEADSPILRKMMKEWACSETKVLSIAVCHDDENENLSLARHLPEELYENDIPIMVKVHDKSMLERIKTKEQASMMAFGMDECSHDVMTPLISMAKMINYVYNEMQPDNIDMNRAEELWAGLDDTKKMSNISHAMTISTKMRSLGHSDQDQDTFYSIAEDEIEVLAEVEHNRWSVEELLLGFRPVTDEEQQIIEKDISRKREFRNRFIHYDLRAYDDLRPDANGTDVRIYDRCISAAIPLIAKKTASSSI